MDGNLKVRALAAGDAQALVALRTEALERHPLSFSASIENDFARSVEAARAALVASGDSAIFGLFSAVALVGMVGVGRATKVKRRHQASVWGMYTSAEEGYQEGKQRLLEATIAWARSCPGIEQLRISTAESAVEIRELCSSMGFREWGLNLERCNGAAASLTRCTWFLNFKVMASRCPTGALQRTTPCLAPLGRGLAAERQYRWTDEE